MDTLALLGSQEKGWILIEHLTICLCFIQRKGKQTVGQEQSGINHECVSGEIDVQR